MSKKELCIGLAADLDVVRALWSEYWESLGLSATFQDFGAELRGLPGKYRSPEGALAVATLDGQPAGTVALRPLMATACEVKRLYVRPEFRGRGVGRALVEWVIEHARSLGYSTVHGDTLPTMTGALRMYLDMGFRVMEQPYSEDPTPGAIYLQYEIRSTSSSEISSPRRS